MCLLGTDNICMPNDKYTAHGCIQCCLHINYLNLLGLQITSKITLNNYFKTLLGTSLRTDH